MFGHMASMLIMKKALFTLLCWYIRRIFLVPSYSWELFVFTIKVVKLYDSSSNSREINGSSPSNSFTTNSLVSSKVISARLSSSDGLDLSSLNKTLFIVQFSGYSLISISEISTSWTPWPIMKLVDIDSSSLTKETCGQILATSISKRVQRVSPPWVSYLR